MNDFINDFVTRFHNSITGTLSTFDRMILKGHLSSLYPKDAFACFLWSQGVLLKNFSSYAQRVTAQLKDHAQGMANAHHRPFVYLEAPDTDKDAVARHIAQRDNIRQGLVCVLSVLESATVFTVRKNPDTQQLETTRRPTKCLQFYFYSIDPKLGWIHVRLQSWFPFPIQIYLNGREWLARQLDRRAIRYERYENSFTWIEDLKAAQRLCEKFAHRRLPRLLSALARQVNPMLGPLQRAGFRGYYWVLEQCEFATDVMFRDRQSLEAIYPSLVEHARGRFSAEDVLRFLGKKYNGNFAGEVTTDGRRRPEGWRVKHWVKQNSLKMYDKWSVLRVEVTINNPRWFKVLRVVETSAGRQRRWVPMGKGVANLWRYAQVAEQANRRYLNGLAQVPTGQEQGKAVCELDRLCRSCQVDGRRYGRFEPVSERTVQLFRTVLAGEHAVVGFRNRDVACRLYGSDAGSARQRRRRGARVTRQLRKLRAHGLIGKVKDSRLYRVTLRGVRLMTAAIRCREVDFPQNACAI